jgi:protein-L-isoaspartate(D-aspartate) O-methyltransferase
MISREEMLEQQIQSRDIDDQRVIEAMATVDRKLFVPENYQDRAYEDGPLPIGEGQTISQPYIVAYMAQALDLKPDDKVLEIGSGCGYNAAVLSRLAKEVYSLEIVDWLADLARKNLSGAEYKNVHLRHADGYQGWAEAAPFDAIILTAAPPEIPKPLREQLKIGGKLLAPVGTWEQVLVLLKRTGPEIFTEHRLHPVSFVPMTGQAGK